MTKTKKLAFINGKGGCGKTTSIFNIAGVLSKAGEKVLVIDLDKQCNSTMSLLMNNEQPPEKTVLDFFLGECSPEEATGKAYFSIRDGAKPKYYNVDIMTGDKRLKDADLFAYSSGDDYDLSRIEIKQEYIDFLARNNYDWVLIDMPPSSEILNKICFSQLAEYVIVPSTTDFYSASGYADLIESVNIAREINPNLKILGIYLSRYRGNGGLQQHIKNMLEEFGEMFIDVQIPESADITEAVYSGRPISYYKYFANKFSKSAKSRNAYEKLVEEIIDRMNRY